VIQDIGKKYDDVRLGPWHPQGGGGTDYVFFRQGSSVVVTKSDGEFVTVLTGGDTNSWFLGASAAK
jgi:hypothetical protein